MTPKFTNEMTIAEAARHTNVSRRTVQRWIKNGRVKSRLFRGKRMIDASTLPECRTTMPYDRLSQSTLIELTTIVQQLIDLQPVSNMKGVNKRQELRRAVERLLMRLNDTNRD
ncbi:MAG: helix-turn-helix domain-containing protein [Pseudomonadota bacterium]